MIKKSKPVKDLDINSLRNLVELVEKFEDLGGFSPAYLSRAVKILRKMINEKECTRWFSFVGSIIATGVRGVISEVLRRGLFHCVITTCGALDHDIARSLGEYYVGDFRVDDITLLKSGLHRVGSVFIPQKIYGEAIEKFMQELLKDIYSQGVREIGTYELCRVIGERLEDRQSILRGAYEGQALIFVPGIMDGAVGTQLWLFNQRHRDFKLNLFRDFDKLAEITFKMTKSGALIVGGGISKHHLIWWAQFSGGLDYAIQLTTATEHDGSLSGATLSEAISWKKLKPTAEYVTVYGDATLLLPLIFASIL